MGMRTPEGIDWGKFPPERRGRWGSFLLRMRYEAGKDDPATGKRIPITQAEVLRRLEGLGRQVDETSYSLLETGRRDVSADLEAVFIRLYGRGPDEPSGAPAPVAPSDIGALVPALAALVAQLARQNDERDELRAQLTMLADEMRRMRDETRELREELRAHVASAGPHGAPTPGGPDAPPSDPSGRRGRSQAEAVR